MEHLHASGIRTIRLEADPPGVPLYRRLGFAEEFESPRFYRPDSSGRMPVHAGWMEPPPEADGTEHRPRTESGRVERQRRHTAAEHGSRHDTARLGPAELAAVAAFDGERFGDPRGRLLQLLFEQARATYVIRVQGQVAGYAFAWPSSQGVRIGPWIAADDETAQALLRAILADWPGTGIILGVPSRNPRVPELLAPHGFERVACCLRMVHGPAAGEGRPEEVFAIANGAMG
jgi:ribosomal protein S18 acetylase RimI-like enzyme